MQPAEEDVTPQAGLSVRVPAGLEESLSELKAAVPIPGELCQLYSGYLAAETETAKKEADVLGRLQIDIPWLLHAFGELDRATHPSAEQRETFRQGAIALMEHLKEGGFFSTGQKAWEEYASRRSAFLRNLAADQRRKLEGFCVEFFRFLAPARPGMATMVSPTDVLDFLVEKQCKNEGARLEEFVQRQRPGPDSAWTRPA